MLTDIERNLALARRFVEGVLGGADPAAFAEIVHPDIVLDSGLKPEGKIRGAAEYGSVLGSTLGAGSLVQADRTGTFLYLRRRRQRSENRHHRSG